MALSVVLGSKERKDVVPCAKCRYRQAIHETDLLCTNGHLLCTEHAMDEKKCFCGNIASFLGDTKLTEKCCKACGFLINLTTQPHLCAEVNLSSKSGIEEIELGNFKLVIQTIRDPDSGVLFIRKIETRCLSSTDTTEHIWSVQMAFRVDGIRTCYEEDILFLPESTGLVCLRNAPESIRFQCDMLKTDVKAVPFNLTLTLFCRHVSKIPVPAPERIIGLCEMPPCYITQHLTLLRAAHVVAGTKRGKRSKIHTIKFPLERITTLSSVNPRIHVNRVGSQAAPCGIVKSTVSNYHWRLFCMSKRMGSSTQSFNVLACDACQKLFSSISDFHDSCVAKTVLCRCKASNVSAFTTENCAGRFTTSYGVSLRGCIQ